MRCKRFKPIPEATRERYVLERLEARILFSAESAVLSGGLPHLDADDDSRYIAGQFDRKEAQHSSGDTPLDPADRTAQRDAAGVRLIVIDTSVPDLERLLERLESGKTPSTSIQRV